MAQQPLTTGGSVAGDGVMSSLVHPRRSVMYTPGSRASAIEKCRGLGDKLGLDGCILDLEDAVAPSAKVEAREQVNTAVDDPNHLLHAHMHTVPMLTL